MRDTVLLGANGICVFWTLVKHVDNNFTDFQVNQVRYTFLTFSMKSASGLGMIRVLFMKKWAPKLAPNLE